MRFRFLILTTSVLAFCAVALVTSRCWAHWYALGPSKDEWGLKYDGKVEAAKSDKVNVQFTLADQGRLKPIHSVFVMAFSNPDRTGTQLVKTPISMKQTADGKLTGQVEIGKEHANRAMVRIFTMTVDGRSQATGPSAGARYYDIPLNKLAKNSPPTASAQSRSTIAAPAIPNVAR